MARRIKVNPEISVGHYNYTGMNPVATAEDAPHVRVTFPELEWLAEINIDVDDKTGAVKISVIPSMPDSPVAPDLTVHPSGAFQVRS